MRRIFWLLFMLVSFMCATNAQQENVDQLKQRIEHSSPADQVRFCLHVAQAQLQHVDDLYKAGDTANARRALQDVETYAVRAANTSAQSGKHMKDAEIAVRKISERLNNIARDADFDERPPIKASIAKIDNAHDKLLAKMFSKK
jgi:hypothetical protein